MEDGEICNMEAQTQEGSGEIQKSPTTCLDQEIVIKGVLNISDAEITAKFVHLYEIFSIEHIALKSPTFASTR